MKKVKKNILCIIFAFILIYTTSIAGTMSADLVRVYATGEISLFMGIDPSAAILVTQDKLKFRSVAVDRFCDIYTSSDGDKIYKYTLSTGQWSTLSLGHVVADGSSQYPGSFNNPQSIEMDNNGNLYVVDKSNNRIQRYNESQGWSVISLGLGTGVGCFNNPEGTALDNNGNLYVADYDNNRIEKYTASTGQWSVFIDGSAGSIPSSVYDLSKIYEPQAVAFDSSGNVYIGEAYQGRLIKQDISTGQRTLLVSVQSVPSCSSVYDIDVNGDNDIFIADNVLNDVMKYSLSTGIVSIIISNGNSLDEVFDPRYMNFDQCGNLLVCDVGVGQTLGIKKYEIISSNMPFNAKVLSAALNPGAMTLVSPTLGRFEPITLDGKMKTVTLVASGGSIVDATGSGSGWILKVSATQFADRRRTNVTLPRGSFALTKAPSPKYHEKNSSDISGIATSTEGQDVDQPTPLTVFSAAKDSGMGVYDISDHEFTLTMHPQKTHAGIYSTTITYTIEPKV